MKIMSFLFGWMQPKPHEGDNPALYPLDYDRLRKELDVTKEAERLGLANSPAPDKTSLSAIEVRIIDRIEEYRSKVVTWSLNHLQYLQRRMADLDVTKDVNRALEAGNEFKRCADDSFSNHQPILIHLDEIAKRHQDDLATFQARNGLTRMPKKPMSLVNKSIWISLLIAAVLIEGIANSIFFSAGLDGGLIQGFSYAGVLALVNVAGGFFIGLIGLKQLFHKRVLMKTVGLACMLVGMALTLGIALITTHLRDAFSIVSIEGDAMAIALRTVSESPLNFHGLDSIILFLMSVMFSIAAMIKGLTWGDVYPGYSAAYDRMIQSRDLYDSQVEAFWEELQASKQSFEDSLDKTVDESARKLGQLKELIDEKSMLGDRMRNYLGKAEYSASSLIALFRTENEIHRTSPSPVYFSEEVLLKPISTPEMDTTIEMADLERQQSLHDALLHEIELIRSQIQSAYVKCYDQVTPIRDHMRSA